MCECERRKLKRLVAAGIDLVDSIKKANWGDIRHPTMHMDIAVGVWNDELKKAEEELGCLSHPKKVD